MTTRDDENRHKLDQILTRAHRVRQIPLRESGWNESVMQEVRRLARQPPSIGPNGSLALLVWRTAGLAMALAILLMVSLLMKFPKAMSHETGLMAEDAAVDLLFFE